MTKNNEKPLLFGESDKIWQEIKGLQLNLFGLPNQTIEKNCVPQLVEPSKLYLIISSGAVYPALDEILSSKFNLETISKYIVVSRKEK